MADDRESPVYGPGMTDDLPEIEILHLDAEDADEFSSNYVRVDLRTCSGREPAYVVTAGMHDGNKIYAPLSSHPTLDDAIESVRYTMANLGRKNYAIIVVSGTRRV